MPADSASNQRSLMQNSGYGSAEVSGLVGTERASWWVVWPLERVIADNEDAWREKRLPASLLAFGDDGTGNPFCAALDDAQDEVLRWSWIDGDVEAVVGSMAEFMREWVVRARYPCPCCGFLTHDEEPGDFEYCTVCGWQDDLSQLRFVSMGGGANRLSLIEAQAEFLATPHRPALDGFERDPASRPFDPAVDTIEVPVRGRDYGTTCADDPTTYYYWRASNR
jgi:hypothetical protein